MKQKKRVLSLIVVLMMLASLFGACGNSTVPAAGTPSAAQQSQSAQAESQAPAQESAAATETPLAGPSWSWDTSPVELDWFIDQSWFTSKWDAENTLVYKTITEKTGVTVNWSVPPGDANEKLNVMMASGDLPDMMTISLGMPQIKLLQQYGNLYPLMELVDQYAPTFKENIPESMVNWFTEDDGNWYGFPNFFDAPEKAVGATKIAQNAGMIARKDMMAQLGITAQDLTTQDGVLAALKKVKDAKLSYGDANVVPLLLPEAGDIRDGFFLYDVVLPGFFGIPLEDENGVLVDVRKDPKYLEALKFINACYREGFIAKDNFTFQKEQHSARLTNGTVFLAIGNLGDFKNPMKELYTADSNAEYIPVGPIRARDNSNPTLIGSGANGWTVTMVTKNSKKADRAIRFMEYMYSDEGNLLGHWGVEGVTCERTADGYFKHTEQYLKEKTENGDKAAADYGLENLYWVHNWQQIVGKMPRATEGAALVEQNMWDYYSDDMIYDGRAFSAMTLEANTPVAIQQSEIKSYLIKTLPRIILAASEGECETAYNEMMTKIYGMGQEEVTKALNEKFQANKSKLGIKFMGPWHN